jgi:hypothetical protein
MSTFKEDWHKMPKWLRIAIYSILGVLGAAALGVLFGFIIMWLWNWLMPMLFGLKEITYWQGVGIFILAKILFGSIGGHSGDSKEHKHKKEYRFGPHGEDDCKADRKAVEYYDEWWESKGKKAFEEYVEVKKDDEDSK